MPRVQLEIPDLLRFYTTGMVNLDVLDLARIIEAGQVVTVILSDAPFEVPDTLPGGAQKIASRQHQVENIAVALVRLVERE